MNLYDVCLYDNYAKYEFIYHINLYGYYADYESLYLSMDAMQSMHLYIYTSMNTMQRINL